MMVAAKRAAFSGSLRGLKLIPTKWRYLVPPRRVELCRHHPRVPRKEHAGLTQAVRPSALLVMLIQSKAEKFLRACDLPTDWMESL